MTELTGKTIANTYKQLLRVGVSTNTGVSAGLSTIETGDGTDSSFQLATGSAKFTGTLAVTGNVSLDGNIHIDDKVCASAFYGDGSNITGVTATIAGNISVSNATIGGNLHVAGNTTIIGTTQIRGVVTAADTATFKSTVTVLGATQLQSTVTAVGAATFKSTVTVEGAATFDNNVSVSGVLNVLGAATFTSKATFNDDVSVSGALDVAGNTSVGGTFMATGAATFDNNVSISGGLVVGGTVTIVGANVQAANARVCASAYHGDGSNITNISGAQISGDISVSNIKAAGNVSVGGAFYVGGTVTIAGTNIKAVNAAVCASSFYGDGSNLTNIAASIVNNRVAGNFAVSANLSVGGTSNFAGAVSLASTLSVVGAANFASTVTVVGATHLQSTVSTAGAATFASTVTVVGAATFKSNVSVSGTTKLLGTVTATGNTGFLGTVRVSGATSLEAALNVTGAALFSSTVTVAGATHLQSTVSIAGAATFASTVTVVGATHLQSTASVGGAATFASTVTVVGATHLQSTVSVAGNTQLSGTLTVGVDDTGHDVKFFGATSGSYMLWDESTDDLILGGAARMGIGVAAPAYELDVVGNARLNPSSSPVLRLSENGTLRSLITASSTLGFSIEASGDKPIVLQTNGAERMRVNATGVGIGTTAPSQLLDVSSTGGPLAAFSSSATEGGYVQWNRSGTAKGYIGVGGSIITSGGADNFSIRATSSLLFSSGGASERMRITSTGLVGIGTTAPAGILNVKGTGGDAMPATSGSTQSAGLITRLQQGGGIGSVMDIGGNGGSGSWIQVTEGGDLSTNYKLLLNPNGGNVGIGLTAPEAKLHVIGAASGLNDGTIALFEGNNDGGNRGIHIGQEGTGSQAWPFIQGYHSQAVTNYWEMLLNPYGGNIGIGVTDAAELLHVYTATNPAIQIQSSAGNCYVVNRTSDSGMELLNAMNGPMEFYTNNAERMRIDSAGNVGIGTTSPSTYANGFAPVLVVGTGNNFATIQGRTDGPSAAANGVSYGASYSTNPINSCRIFMAPQGGTGQSGLMVFETKALNDSTSQPLERMRIDAAGNLLVGATAAPSASVSGVLISSPNVGVSRWSRASGTTATNQIAFSNANGDVGIISTSGSTTTYATSSDYRLKNTITPMIGALARVAALKPVTFKWTADNSDGEGFIAHELKTVVPDCVSGEKDAVDAEGKPQYQGVDTSFLVATLTAAIQEQQALIEALTTRITTLEG